MCSLLGAEIAKDLLQLREDVGFRRDDKIDVRSPQGAGKKHGLGTRIGCGDVHAAIDEPPGNDEVLGVFIRGTVIEQLAIGRLFAEIDERQIEIPGEHAIEWLRLHAAIGEQYVGEADVPVGRLLRRLIELVERQELLLDEKIANGCVRC